MCIRDSRDSVAVDADRIAIVRRLIECKTSLRGDPWSPQWMAARKNRPYCLQMILENGADADSKCTFTGATPMYAAASVNACECVAMLVEAKASVDTRTFDHRRIDTPSAREMATVFASMDGAAPLHIAAARGHLETVDVLVRSKANLEACTTTRDLRRPLHVASNYNHFDVVQLLLLCGADPTAVDADGATAFDIASRCGAVQCAELLMAHGGCGAVTR